MTEGVLEIATGVSVSESCIELNAIRAQGAGGQNVNKVASAIHLRFAINTSDLPQWVKSALIHYPDQRITQDKVIVIKAQRYRTQEQNRRDALNRLIEFIAKAIDRPAKRIPTKPSRAARKRRTDSKTKRGDLKQLRRKVNLD